jgi:subtilase family protein/cyclic patellamide precursor peptide PatG
MSSGVFGTGGEPLPRPPIRRPMAVRRLAPAHEGYFPRQDRDTSPQPAGLAVAVIDGPFDATALSEILARTPVSVVNGSCDANGACGHGTFMMGLIGARRDAPIPGLCPECQLVHVQLFADEGAPRASLAKLADAITAAVAAGAKLINLSLAIQGEGVASDPALARALDRAEAHDTVIMVAAGNEGRRASSQLLSHPVTIPVVAVDATHQLLPHSNFGPAMSARGIAAIGHQAGYAPGGGGAVMSGTSVATAVATGTLAQLWSERPHATGKQVRAAVAGLPSRHGPIPPTLDRESFLAELDREIAASAVLMRPILHNKTNYVTLQGKTTMIVGNGLPRTDASGPAATSAQPVTPANGCMCGAPGGTCTCGDAGPSNFVYVLGTVDVKAPDQSISEEFQRWVEIKDEEEKEKQGKAKKPKEKKEDEEEGLQQGPNEDFRHWFWRILTKYPDETRYIARQFCWILRVEGEPAYYLTLRDMEDFDGLVDCLGAPAHEDLCLFVGSSSLQLVEISQGIKAPVLAVDQVQRLKMTDMRGKFKKGQRKAPPDPDKFYDELYRRLFQSADNFGHTDEWRALNFLASGKYPKLFELCCALAHDEYNLTAFPVLTSRLSAWGNKRIVDAIFTFSNKGADVQKYFVRIDVTHLFPILATKYAEYIDRVNL